MMESRAVWVMTISRDYTTVKFWEAKNHENYNLKGRILKEEIKPL